MNRRDLLNELYNLNCTENGVDDDYESSSSSSSDSSDSENASSDDEYDGGIVRKRGDRGDSESDKSIIKRLLADLDKTGCVYEFKTRQGSFSVTSSQNELRGVSPEARVPAQSPDSFPPPLFVVNGKSEGTDKTTFLRYAKPFHEIVTREFLFGNDIEKIDPKTVDEFTDAFFDYKNGNDTTRDDVTDVFNRRILKKKNEIDTLDDIPALVSGNINNNDNDDDETLYDIIEEEMTDICQQLSVCIVEYENTLRARKEAKSEGDEEDVEEEKRGPQDKKAGKKQGAAKAQAKTSQETPQKGKGKGKKSEPPPQKPKQDDSPLQAPPPLPPLAQKEEEKEKEKDEPCVVGRCCYSGCKESGGKILSTDSYSEFRCTAKCVFMLHKKCIKQFDNNLNNGFVQGGNGGGGGGASSGMAGGAGGGGGCGSGNCPGCNYMDCPTPSCWGKLMSVRRVTVDNGVQNEKLIVVIKKDQIKKLFGTKSDQSGLRKEVSENSKKTKSVRKKVEKKGASLSLSQGQSSASSSSGPTLPPVKQSQPTSAQPAITTPPTTAISAKSMPATKTVTAIVKKNIPTTAPMEKDEAKAKESEKSKDDSGNEKEKDVKKKGPEITGVGNDKGAKIIVIRKTSSNEPKTVSESSGGNVINNSSGTDQKLSGKKKSAKEPSLPIAAQSSQNQKAVENEAKKKNTADNPLKNEGKDGKESVPKEKEKRERGLISFDPDVFSQGYWNRDDYPPWTGDDDDDSLFVKLGWKGKGGKPARPSPATFKYRSVFGELFY